MFLQRSAFTLARRAAATTNRSVVKRTITSSLVRRDATSGDAKSADNKLKPFAEVKSEEDLIPTGGATGTVPTDIVHATGLERLEILGKMEGVDIFDMKPLDASRKGTLQDPIMVRSAGDEQYCGCTGYPVDSHTTLWITISRDHPIGRCTEW
ncbi:MAG: Cytochrome c oxidase subunit 4 [Trichoglossum hirsutum]|nr:MAG: Cytochrome c oxidase subunit 4 [Trichoglossum hirsutum]